MNTATQHTTNSDYNQCIQDCIDCSRTSLETIAYCLQQGGKHSEHSHIKLLHDCVEICQTTADFMIRKSAYNPQICDICKTICNACADACEQVEPGDQMMLACVQMCRTAANTCNKMSS